MAWQFSVLASGSAGNASLFTVDGFGVLIDLGLGPRTLADRLRDVPAAWHHVHAALLSHTHGDHWNGNTLKHLGQRGIPLYCHPAHAEALADHAVFAALRQANLVRHYRPGMVLELAPGFRCMPVELAHDDTVTCGFRFDGLRNACGDAQALGYAADLGSWHAGLAGFFANVDVLAVEFNHDVHLQTTSGRARHLIERVLGDAGHLSNEQAADLVRAVLAGSAPGKLRHVVQLHLSRDCNRPALARAAAQKVVDEARAALNIHTAMQHRPGPVLSSETEFRASRQDRFAAETISHTIVQPLFPDWDD